MEALATKVRKKRPGKEVGKLKILIEILMVEPRDYLLSDSPIQLIEVHPFTRRGRNRALDGHQYDIIMAVPIGIIALPKRRHIFSGG